MVSKESFRSLCNAKIENVCGVGQGISVEEARELVSFYRDFAEKPRPYIARYRLPPLCLPEAKGKFVEGREHELLSGYERVVEVDDQRTTSGWTPGERYGLY